MVQERVLDIPRGIPVPVTGDLMAARPAYAFIDRAVLAVDEALPPVGERQPQDPTWRAPVAYSTFRTSSDGKRRPLYLHGLPAEGGC